MATSTEPRRPDHAHAHPLGPRLRDTFPQGSPTGRHEGRASTDKLGSANVVKFGALVGLAGIFYDAALAHGLAWENDPYWTYWVTKTFLITTVFSLVTAFFGIGMAQGIVGTAVHTAILEVYYQWLSPIGLPRESQWLDFDHLWVTGVPLHYGVILAGYLTGLWLWRRRPATAAATAQATPRRIGLFALAATTLVLAFDGLLVQGTILRENPGLTFFVVRALISVPFFLALATYVGLDVAGVVFGGALLALIWTTYSIYLGPTGLPWGQIHYPGFESIWLRALPGQVPAMLIGTWMAARLTGLDRLPAASAVGPDGAGEHAPTPRWLAPALGLAVLLGAGAALASGIALARQPDAPGLEVGATASGEALVARGPDPYALGQAAPTSARIEARAVETGDRWSPLQSKDTMEVTAEFRDPRDGAAYRVAMNTPMRQEPQGRYTTWFGVSLGHAHHGDTGIDTPALPRVASELALWGYADVYRDGQLVAGGKPAHVMVVKKEQGSLPGQVFLSVGTEEKDLVGVPDGYINVVWRKVDGLSTASTQGVAMAHERQSEAGLRPADDLEHLVRFGRREVLGSAAILLTVAALALLAIYPWPAHPRAVTEQRRPG